MARINPLRGVTARALLGLALTGCTALTNTEFKGGLGTSCTMDSDCQNARCLFADTLPSGSGGVCATACQGNPDCSAPSRCAAGFCRPVTKVGAIFVGSANDLDGWTLAHDTGLRAAAAQLGYVDLSIKYGVLPGAAAPLLSALAPVSDIVLTNGIDYETELRASASANPKLQYLMIDNLIYSQGGTNVTPYGTYQDEGYYLAGKIAAQRATKRIGFIAGFIFPESVRLLNAYTLGARSVNPNIVVEVRYIGFFSDLNTTPMQKYNLQGGGTVSYFREQLLTRLLIDSGCEVIAHYSDTQRTTRLVQQFDMDGTVPRSSVFTIAFGSANSCKDGAGILIDTCLGSVFNNWQRPYRTMIDQIARQGFNPLVPARFEIDDTPETAVGYAPNSAGRQVDVIAGAALNTQLARMPAPRQFVFQGPYNLNGQRDSDFDGIPDPAARQVVAAGETLSDAENARSCFFVEGVVEKSNPDDVKSADRPALVPGGLHPGATTPSNLEPLLPGAYNLLTIPAGIPTDCNKNAAPPPKS